MINRRELRHRVLSRIVKRSDGCWIWQGSLTRGGYGTYKAMGLATTAHRIAYLAWIGEIPSELELDHKCRNTDCVNPAHLEPVTHTENVRRGQKASRTHCVAGHEFTPKNTRIKPNGTRGCRTCNAAYLRAARRADPE